MVLEIVLIYFSCLYNSLTKIGKNHFLVGQVCLEGKLTHVKRNNGI